MEKTNATFKLASSVLGYLVGLSVALLIFSVEFYPVTQDQWECSATLRNECVEYSKR